MSNKDRLEPPLDPDLSRGAWLTLILIGCFVAAALWMIHKAGYLARPLLHQ